MNVSTVKVSPIVKGCNNQPIYLRGQQERVGLASE